MNSSTRTIALNPTRTLTKGMFAGLAFVLAMACAQGASASDRFHGANGYDGASNGLVTVGFRNRSSRSFRNGRNSRRNFRNGVGIGLALGGIASLNRGYYNYSSPRANYSSGCHRVSRDGFWNGRRASIGGRQCIDSRGYSYIVPNSRFLIRYW